MLVIGITGNLGSGKSTVAGMFADLGARVLDADKIAHQLMRPGEACYRAVVKTFGEEMLTGGKIDRGKVAKHVFQHPQQRRKLERIIHPEVRKVILAKIKQYRKNKRTKAVVIDVPLLFESKLAGDVDKIVVVKAGRAAQIARATKFLKITNAEAQRRIRAQMPLRKKIRLADIIIDNSGTFNQTQKQVKKIWEKL